MDKAHIEHAVGFIQDKDFYIDQREEALPHQVQQTTRCGYQDIYATGQSIGLRLLRYATKDDGMAQPGMTTIGGNTLINLDGQLAGGRQDQGPDMLAHAGAAMQQLQDRYRKGSRLAGARLGAAQ